MCSVCELLLAEAGVGADARPPPAALGRRDPVVLPFYHSGMGRIMPKGGRIPRAGNRVSVLVGAPVELSDLTCRCHRKGEDQRAVRNGETGVGEDPDPLRPAPTCLLNSPLTTPCPPPLQVWKDITARVSAALLALEAASPKNWDQVAGHEAEELARRSEGALPEDG